MDLKKVIKQYALAKYTVSNKYGSVSATATASSNKDSPPDTQAKVLAQVESVKLAMIEVNKRKNNQSKGFSNPPADSNDIGSGEVLNSSSPSSYWSYPMMTGLNGVAQLCKNNTDGIYYSTDTVNWNISQGVNNLYCFPLSISGTYAIGFSETGSTGSTSGAIIYSTNFGKTWYTSQSSV